MFLFFAALQRGRLQPGPSAGGGPAGGAGSGASRRLHDPKRRGHRHQDGGLAEPQHRLGLLRVLRRHGLLQLEQRRPLQRPSPRPAVLGAGGCECANRPHSQPSAPGKHSQYVRGQGQIVNVGLIVNKIRSEIRGIKVQLRRGHCPEALFS